MILRKYIIVNLIFLLIFLAAMIFTGCRPASLTSGYNSDNNQRPLDTAADTAAKNSTPIENDPRRIAGKVVHISDGDTFIIEATNGVRTTVRIHAIDAPELAQSFGKESREKLRALIANQGVEIRRYKTDQYRRIVGAVFLNGKDIGLEMVSLGLAWHFKQYQKEQSSTDRKLFTDAEISARNSRRGLWREDRPMPPQEYRRIHNARR